MRSAVIGSFPASYAQSRLWFLDRMRPESPAYNMVASLALPAGTDRAAVAAALADLAAHHETLRTAFALEGGQVVQHVLDEATIPLDLIEVERREDARPALSALAAVPFDLAAAPLVRAALLVRRGQVPALTLVVHHIIADGETLRLLAGNLLAALAARSAGLGPVLPATPVEYADYAVWQRRSLDGARRDRLVGYWTDRLAGMGEVTLPWDRARGGTPRGGVERFRIPADTAAALRGLARRAQTTLYGVLLTGYAAVLSRIAGQHDLPIGIPVSGRTRVEFERVAGLFINSLVFRARLAPEEPWIDAVRRLGADLAADLSQQEMPFELLVETLRPPRRASANPLFQTMFQMQVRDVAPGPDDQAQVDGDVLSSQLDLSLILFDSGSGPIDGGAIYAADLFDAATVAELVAAYLSVLAAAARDETTPLARLPLLDPERRSARLALARGPSLAWPGPVLLHDAFAETARRFPGRTAVDCGTARLSYAALEARAAAVADGLRAAGVGSGAIVAIALPRSPEGVAAMIGVLQAGGAYLALDPALPEMRRRTILADCNAAALIDAAGIVPLAAAAPFATAAPAAYVIYTSGSTGAPSGVAIPHGAATNHMRWMIDRFGIGPSDRVLQRTPLSFDASVWEVWVPLLAGGTLVLTEARRAFDPPGLLAEVERRGITVLQTVPSLMAALLDDPAAAALARLRHCFCGGEPLPGALAARFRDLTDRPLVNLYGPSETTIDATFHIGQSGAEATVPLGRPVANTAAYVLDAGLAPVPAGFAGELCIGGRAVGLGYLGAAAGRAGRFVADPHDPGGRLFRTGDRAVMRADGTILFRGRIDDQVKLRGVRIEPGEVEAEALRHPAVAEAAAVVQSHGAGDDRLVLYARPGSGALAEADLAAWLRDRLAPHAVPSAIHLTGPLPRTPHGKVDRAALRAMRTLRSAAGGPAVRTPDSPLEAQIRAAFAAVLGVESVAGDDDFFQSGGHSLLVVPLAMRLAEALGRDVTIVDIFEHATAQQLARALQARGPLPPFPPPPFRHEPTEARQ